MSILFLLIPFALFSLDGDFGINLGVLGITMNTDSKIRDVLLYGRLINIMYHTENGVELALSPLNFWINLENTDYSSITFLNTFLYYNFLNNDSKYLLLGPFASIHALGYKNPEFFEFRTGLSFSLRNVNIFYSYNNDPVYPGRILKSDFISLEGGYKYNTADKHGAYFHLGIDFLFMLMLISTDGGRAYEERQKKY